MLPVKSPKSRCLLGTSHAKGDPVIWYWEDQLPKKEKAVPSQNRSLSSEVIYYPLDWKLIHNKIQCSHSLILSLLLVILWFVTIWKTSGAFLSSYRCVKDAHYRPLHQEDDITLHASFKSSSFHTEPRDTIVPDLLCACWEWWDYNSSWQCSVPRKLTALFSFQFPLPLWSHLILNLIWILNPFDVFLPLTNFHHTFLCQNVGEDY